MKYHYRETTDVSPAIREAAEQACIQAQKDLGLPAVSLIWMQSCPEPTAHTSPDPLAAWMLKSVPDRIWVVADSGLSPREIAGFVAHEMRHLWQVNTGRVVDVWAQRDDLEWDAERYQEQALGRRVAGRAEIHELHQSLAETLRKLG